MTKLRKFVPASLFLLGLVTLLVGKSLIALGDQFGLIVQVFLWLLIVFFSIFSFIGSVIYYHRCQASTSPQSKIQVRP